MVNMPHRIAYDGYRPQGAILKYKGHDFFLATKATTWLWFGMDHMVIGIDHPHTHNGKYVPYIEVCGSQGPILYKYSS